jgi:predicted acetyltransferase
MSDVRKMNEAGPQEVLDLVAYAFQWELSEKNKERYRLLAENSWNYGSYDEQGKLASQIMATQFAVDFHGANYPMAGIGFVASYPEYRGQGRIDRIMTRILEDCYEQGIILSYLAPFSFPFYRRYGYEYVFERLVYDVPAHEWADSPKVAGSIQRLSWEKAKDVIHTIYHAMPRHQKGGLIREEWWERIKFTYRKPYTFAIYRDEKGNSTGYLIYTIQDGKFIIEEWSYLTVEAYHGLNRFIVSHADSVARIIYQPGFDNDIRQTIAAKPMENYQVKPDMMARVVDVAGFLERYPFTYKQAGTFAIEIQEDKYAPWNNGIYEISIADGQHTVKKVDQTQLPTLQTTVQHFVQLFMGYQTIETMAFLEQVTADDCVIECLKYNLPTGKPLLEDYF